VRSVRYEVGHQAEARTLDEADFDRQPAAHILCLRAWKVCHHPESGLVIKLNQGNQVRAVSGERGNARDVRHRPGQNLACTADG
jgi:hypothetical protein